MNNNDNKNQIKISGSIGMIHLKGKANGKDKNIYIYYDDHSNKNYCSQNDSIFLYDLFENIRKKDSDHIILLEEPFVNNYSNKNYGMKCTFDSQYIFSLYFCKSNILICGQFN